MLSTDFSLSTSELQFGPGDEQQSVTFASSSDSIAESAETFVISFSSADAAVMQPIAVISITIMDDGDCMYWTGLV